MRNLALAAALLLTTPAWGQNILPPAEYDIIYDGELVIKRLPLDQLHAVCRQKTIACTHLYGETTWVKSKGKCYIFMAEDDVIIQHHWTPEHALRHEIGHCNGWPKDHPGMRSVKEAGPSPYLATKLKEILPLLNALAH